MKRKLIPSLKSISKIFNVILLSLFLSSSIYASVSNITFEETKVETVKPKEQPNNGKVVIYYYTISQEARIVYQVEYRNAIDVEAITVLRDYSVYITKLKGLYHYKIIKADEKKMHEGLVQYIRTISLW